MINQTHGDAVVPVGRADLDPQLVPVLANELDDMLSGCEKDSTFGKAAILTYLGKIEQGQVACIVPIKT